MPDYIEFTNWPNVDKLINFGVANHVFDDLPIEEIYNVYLKMKEDNPGVHDETLSTLVDKRPWYFSYIKRRIGREK